MSIGSKKNIYVLIFSAISFLIAGVFPSVRMKYSSDALAVAKKVQAVLQKEERAIDNYLKDKDFILQCSENKLSEENLKKISKEGFALLIYQKDSLIFWSKNEFPFYNNIHSLKPGSNFVKLKNGFYDVLVNTPVYLKDSIEVVVLGIIPLQYEFQLQNRYLHNESVFDNALLHLQITSSQQLGSFPVKDLEGKDFFYVHPDENYLSVNYEVVIFYLLGFFLLFYFFSGIANELKNIGGFIFLLLSVAVVRWLMIELGLPADMRMIELFDPLHYASSGVAQSLGDLMINTILVFWLAIVFFSIKIFPNSLYKNKIRYVLCTLFFSFIFLLSDWLVEVFRSLVIDSNIPLDITDIFGLNYFSIIGMVSLLLALLAFYLVMNKLLSFIAELQLSVWEKAISILIVLGIYYWITFNLLTFSVSIVILLSGILIERYGLHRKKLNALTFQNVIVLLIIFSLFTSLVLFWFINLKEKDTRKNYVQKLAASKDPVAEFIFSDIYNDLASDLEVKKYFTGFLSHGRKSSLFTVESLREKITQKYFSGYFDKKYEIKFFALDTIFNQIEIQKSSDTLLWQNLIGFSFADRLNSRKGKGLFETDNPYFFYQSKDDGSFSCLAQLPIYYQLYPVGWLVMEFIPKSHKHDVVYPELLLDEKVRLPDELEKYDFAVYNHSVLFSKHGYFPYHSILPASFACDGQFCFMDENKVSHLIYNVNSKTIVLSKKKDGLFIMVSLFSYSFIILLMMIIFFQFFEKILNWRRLNFQNIFSNSLRLKIQFALIVVIVFSFISITIVTLFNLNNQFENSHRENLIRKIDALSSEIQSILSSNSLGTKIQNEISTLSENHSIDINIFQQDGRLLTTSQQDIYEKGLVSANMNPLAYYALNKKNESLFVQEEKIGALNYLSAYVPLKDNSGINIAFLNLPYFSNEKDLANEISSFLTALINVYVLLLLLTGIAAFLIANSISTPLTLVVQRFKEFSLIRKNKQIQWHREDEIGVLVNEYNKMIFELENSTEQLAKSERESAWREMAKQVAHEIKNPLTTMKLVIQHLQIANRDNALNLKELTVRTANIIVEQIDNLSNIATAFSSFAQMPKAINENVNIDELLKNVVELFRENINIKIKLVLAPITKLVFADKNQLLQVFNNLLQNAIQSIPEEREGKILVLLEIKSEKKVLIKFIDNGTGIPEEQREKIFTPNFTTKSSGMGLGLAISKSIIENANGKIWFETQENTGTTFFVELPIIVTS